MSQEMSFSERLKAARVAAEYSQAATAVLLGIARQTYLDYETGKTEPKRGMLVAVSALFDMPISHWFPELCAATEPNRDTLLRGRLGCYSNATLASELNMRLSDKPEPEL